MGRVKEMQDFEQVHVGMKQLNWPNGELWWVGGVVMKDMLIAKGYVSRCVADAAVILFAVLLHDANKNDTKNCLHINFFFPLPIELKSRPLTCKCIQHLALAVHQVTHHLPQSWNPQHVPYSSPLPVVRERQFAFRLQFVL